MKALIKIGGSVFDLGPKAVLDVCNQVIKFSKDNQFVLAVGGGPSLDVLKNIRGEIGEEMYQYLSQKAIVINAKTIEALIPNSKYLDRTEIGKADELLNQGVIPIVTHIDKSLSADSPFRNSTTDSHDVAIAEYLKIKDIVFIKDIQGIFDKDPHLYKDTVFIETATPEDFFSGKINRVGTDGKDKHLMEDDALHLLLRSQLITSLSIIDCNDPQALEKWLKGEKVGSKIVK